MHDETIKPSRLQHKDIINQMDKWFKNGSTMFSSGQGVTMETLAFASLLMTILYNEDTPILKRAKQVRTVKIGKHHCKIINK